MLNDLRYAFRMLKKNPSFTSVAVLTLALGIGANTAIFSVVNAVLLRPLPYPDPERLLSFTWQYGRGALRGWLDVRQFEFHRDHSTVFQAVAGFRGSSDLRIDRGTNPEWVRALRVTEGFFRTLGVSPALGRGFAPDEVLPGGPQAVVLNDRLWRMAFAADPNPIGQQVRMSDKTYTVVGIMPPGFSFVESDAEVFIPLRLGNTLEDQGTNTRVIGRLKPGITLRQAQADMTNVFEQFQRAFSGLQNDRGVRLLGYQAWLVGDIRPSLTLLLGAVGFLLLIACANVANLLLARATSRAREISIRRALGAGRRRLLRQFFTESLLLSLAGGAAGLLGAVWVLRGLVVSIPWDLPSIDSIQLDGRVLVFTLMVAVGTSLAFGLIAFAHTLKTDLHLSLKEGWSASGGKPGPIRFRKGLLVSEVALSLILLTAAGLLIQSFYCLNQESLGFDPENLMTMRTPLSSEKYYNAPLNWDFKRQVLENIRALPGVASVATVTVLLLSGQNNLPTQRQGHPENSIGGMEYRAISPEYFETMRISLLRGRAFQGTDVQNSQPVAIVSENLARQWWPGDNPIGDHVLVGTYQGRKFPDIDEPPREIVGVVGDVKAEQLNWPCRPTVYVPAAQTSIGSNAWVIRTEKPVDLAKGLRQAVAKVDPEQRVMNIQPMREIVAKSVARPRFNTLLMGSFAGIALLLGAVGLYGLISYTVARQTHEVGIRIALGAGRGDVLKLVVGQGMVLTLIGVGIGLTGALALTRFLSGLLYEVRPTDPLTFLLASLLLMTVAAAASYIPARRAVKVDPMVTLRYE